MSSGVALVALAIFSMAASVGMPRAALRLTIALAAACCAYVTQTRSTIAIALLAILFRY
jgi:hypothetical protein